MQPAPAVPEVASEGARRRLRTDIWPALLTLLVGAQLGALLTLTLDQPGIHPSLASAALSVGAVAAFAAMALFRLTLLPLAAFLAMAVAADAAALALRAHPFLSLWPHPALLLAGALFAGALSLPRRRIRRALAAAPLLALAVSVGAPLAADVLAGALDWSERLGLALALLSVQALAVAALRALRRNRLAGWCLLSVLPGVSGGLLLLWHGGEAESASAALRAGGYAIVGVGAWRSLRAYAGRASSGQLALGLSERVRDAVAGSVDSRVMAGGVAGALGCSLHLGELAILLRTPDGRRLWLAATHPAAPQEGGQGIEVLSPAMQDSVRALLADPAVPGDSRVLTRTQLALPLTARDRDLGVVVLSPGPRPRPAGELALIEIALSQLAMGVANAQLLQESQGRLNRAEALRGLAVETSGDIGVAELGRLVVRHATRLTGAMRAELYLRARTGVWSQYTDSGEAQAVGPPAGPPYAHALRTARVQVVAGQPTSIAAPLISGEEVVGVLAVHGPAQAGDVTEEDEVALMALADQAVVALERARLGESVRRTQRETEALYSIGWDVSFVLNLPEGLRRVAERTARVLSCDLAAILLMEPCGALSVPAASGARGAGLRAGEDLAARGLTPPPAPISVTTVSLDDRLGPLGERLSAEGVESALAVPLQANGRDLGLLLAGQRSRRAWTPDEASLAERIGRQTAIAIENGRLLRAEQETVAKLRQLDSIKSNVIRSASHELRTPLVAVKGYTEILIETAHASLRPPQRRQLRTIAQQTDRVLKLIDNIITVSALEDGGLTVAPAPLALPAFMEDVVGGMRPEAEARGIEIAVDAPRDLPHVLADRAALERVLLNLLDNALKFTPDGGRVRISAGTEDGGRVVRLTVSDSGPGVAPADRPHIFEKFHRGGATVDEAIPGTGLGLAICKGLVELHGGQIGLTPDHGGGASFWLTLPAMRHEQ